MGEAACSSRFSSHQNNQQSCQRNRQEEGHNSAMGSAIKVTDSMDPSTGGAALSARGESRACMGRTDVGVRPLTCRQMW